MIEMRGGKKTFAVIRAVYEHRNSPEEFIRELDFVLERNVNVVIIEPDDLGEVTWRWIQTGNWLHKTAVLTGFAAIAGVCLAVYSEGQHAVITSAPLISVPRGISARIWPSIFCSFISASSAGLYALFWQWDPCCKYQVAKSINSLPSCIATAAAASSCNSCISSRSPITPPSSPSASSSNIAQHDHSHFQIDTVNLLHRTNSSKSLNHRQHEHPNRPVVLIRRDDCYRKIVHNSVSVGAVLLVGLSLLRWRPFSR